MAKEVEIYVSWSKGLPEDHAALDILRSSGLIAGVELSNTDDQFYRIKDAGLKCCCHTPGMDLTLNLAKPDYVGVFETEEGRQILRVIGDSDAAMVGMHLGYSAERVIKMYSYPNVPDPSTIITERDVLLERIVTNVRALEAKLPKKLVLEILAYLRERPIQWNLEKGESLKKKAQIERAAAEHGINAGISYVTEPDFVKEVLERTGAGFCFDMSHVFISADTKIHNGTFQGSVEQYFKTMLTAVDERTHQLHLNAPEGDEETGYTERHKPITPGDEISEHMLNLTLVVMEKSPHISIVTLESVTEQEPVEYARAMVEQAGYITKKLNVTPVKIC